MPRKHPIDEGAGPNASATGLALREDPPLLPLATTRLNTLAFQPVAFVNDRIHEDKHRFSADASDQLLSNKTLQLDP